MDATISNAKAKLRDLDRQKVEPKIQIDRGGLATRRISLIKTALVGLAPAGIPILAGLTAATLGLSGAFAAASAGAGVFGLATVGAVSKAAELSKEITKLEDQLEDTDDIAKRADIYTKLDKVWSDMDDHTKQFVQTLRGSKRVWDQFLAATRPTTLGLASRALEQFGPALAPLPAVVDRFAPVFQSWLSGITNFIRGPGYAGFMDFISTEGPPALENVGRLVGNLTGGVGSLVKTFTPFGQDFLFTLTKGSETFRDWARDLGGTGGFRSFMDYIQQTGPQVVEALGSLAGAIISITQALAPLGGPTLDVISTIASGLGAIADVAPGLIQFALIAGTVARGIGAISDAQIAVGQRVDRFRKTFAGAVGPMAKFRAGLGGAVGLLGGPWGLALAAGTVALGYFATKHAEAQDRVKALTDALKESEGAFNDNLRAVIANNLEQTGALKSAEKLGLSLDTVTDAVTGQGSELGNLRAHLRGVIEANTQFVSTGRGGAMVQNEQARAAEQLLGALDGSNQELNKAVGEYQRFEEASGAAKTSQDGLKFATKAAADAYDAQRRAIEENIAAMQAQIDKAKEARDQALGFQNAQIGLEQAIDDAAEAVTANGKTLDINTQKGRDNKEALLGIASAINEVVDSEEFRKQNAPAQIKILDDQRSRFVAAAVAMGATKEAAKAMADELIKIPKEVTTEAKVKTDEEALAKVKADAEAIPKETTTTAKFVTDDANIAAYQQALGGIPPEKPTAAKFATDNVNVAAYLGALGTIPPTVPTDGTFSGQANAISQWKNDLGSIPDSTQTYGNFNSDLGAVQAYLGYLNSIDGRTVTAYATTVRRVETIYERKTGNLPAHGGIQKQDGGFDYSFAGGGVVPGYAPGMDSVPALLSPGEGILRPEVVKALGADVIHSWNRAAAGMAKATDLQVRVPRPTKSFVIQNLNVNNPVGTTTSDAVNDTAQTLSLMFGDF